MGCDAREKRRAVTENVIHIRGRPDLTKACVIIPVRYASSRFPGKPLTPLLGKSLFLWVAELSALAVVRKHVHVATDDVRIATAVLEAGFFSLMTSSNALTGTDRLAEAAQLVDYDVYFMSKKMSH